MPINNNYNTSSPTPSTKNTINSVTVQYGIRDFLLNLNLTPQQLLPVGSNYSTTINGSPKVGQPVLDTTVGGGSNNVPDYLPLETYGLFWKDNNISKNIFVNTSSNLNDLTNIQYISDVPFVSPNGSSFGQAEWPQGINQYTAGNVDKYGILPKTANAGFKKNNTIKNIYLDETKQIDVSSLIDFQPNDITKQIKGYLDEYGSLNLGDSKGIQAANVVGSVLNGQGLGFAKGGVVTNFDFRSSLAGRVLGGTGVVKDSKLGQIGAQQLGLALANNAAFNIQQDLLGSLNVQNNILSLIKGNGLEGFRPDYTITIPEKGLGRVADYTSKVLGFTIPRSYILPTGSLFQYENGNIRNIDRANALLKTTSKGQFEALKYNVNANFDNLSDSTLRSGYAPLYKVENDDNPQRIHGYYAFGESDGNLGNILALTGPIPDLNFLREEKVVKDFPDLINAGFDNYEQKDGINVNKVKFSWGSNEPGVTNTTWGGVVYKPFIGNKENILTKTQQLFNSIGMQTIVSRAGKMNMSSSQIQTTNGGGISHGSGVLSSFMYDSKGRYDSKLNEEAEIVYCRSWTNNNRYDSVDNLIRSGTYEGNGLYGKDGGRVPFRNSTENTVLEDTGFVKIAPYRNDNLNPEAVNAAKNYMLSIENLAWADDITKLPKVEQGLGDPVTGKRGRIMWFPPYDIQFSESVSVDWEAHKFIGRGENIYTYNNTERTGQLSFKIIVDHPTYANTFRDDTGPDDNYVASYFAGCIEPDSVWTNKFTASETSQIVSKDIITPREKVAPKPELPPDDLFVYFPNDQDVLEVNYENGLSGSTPIDYTISLSGSGAGLNIYPAKFTYKTVCGKNKRKHKDWPDRFNFGLNYSLNSPNTLISNVGDNTVNGWLDPNTMTYYTDYIKNKCPHCNIYVTGYASPQGVLECNKELANARAAKILEEIKTKWCPLMGWTQTKCNDKVKSKDSKPIAAADSTCNPKTGSDTDTLGCKLDRRVRVHFEYDSKSAFDEVATPEPEIKVDKKEIVSKIKQKFYNESMFFDKLEKNDRFIFDKFRDKIKYFHPAFHSMTPEGLNSRLTFLHQCTRQGRTLEAQGANNLAFGRPPVCILRVGDFYNTKIIIDSLNIEYEPLVWDLNPEGIGAQPMIANVSISFKFIGAESLYGPINKLQNALSFNFYANSRVYETRADYLSKETKLKAESVGPDITSGAGTNTVELGEVKLTPVAGYKLQEGESFLSETEVKEYIKTANSELIPNVNQVAANDNALSAENNNGLGSSTGTTTATTITANAYLAAAVEEDKLLFKGTIMLQVSFSEPLDKDYTGKLTIFDAKMNPLNITPEIKFIKGEKIRFFNKLETLTWDTFHFYDKSQTSAKYQAKLEIIGFDKPIMVDTENFSNKVKL